MAFYNNVIAGAAGATGSSYTIERSLRLNPDDASHLSKTPGATGNTKKFTVSLWAKRSSADTHDHLFQSGNSYFRFQSSGELIYYWDGSNSIYTNAKFRDFGSWYSIILAVDTTLSSGKIKFWVNGIEQTTTGTEPGQNSDLSINGQQVHYIGSETASTSVSTFDGYIADFHLLDGIAVTDPYDFGDFDVTTGVWNPIEYKGDFNGAAVAGTSYSSATGAKSLYSTTNDGQTLGSGYSSGAIPNTTKLIIPGISLTEGGGTSGSGQSISNNSVTTVTSNTKYYGTALQFATSANLGSNGGNSFSFSQNLGLSGADFFTLEAWVYPRSGHTQDFVIIFEGDWNNNEGLMFYLNSSRYPALTLGNGSFQSFYSSQQVPFDQWTHVACVNLNNTISFYVNGNKDTASGTRSKNYTLGNNHRHVGAYRDSNHLAGPRNPFYGYMCDIRVTSDSRYSSSFTVPGGGAIPAGVNGFHLDFSDNSSNAALGTDSSGNNNTWTVNNLTAQGTANTFTVLGNQSNSGSSSAINVSSLSTVTSTPETSWPGDSNTYNHLTADFQSVGNYSIHADPFLSASTANIVVFQSDNGTSWTQISKGQSPYSFSGRYIQWVRSGSGYGAQTLNANLGSDQDSLIDTPTDYEASNGNNGGNYCTLNPLQKSSEVTLTNGNLDVSTSNTSNKCKVFGTMAVTSGKWYYEVTIGSNYRGSFGWATDPSSNLAQQPGDSTGDYALTFDGQKVKSGAYTASYGTAYSSGMVVGIRLDATAGTVAFSQNGVDKGNAYTGQTGLTWWPIVGDASSGGTFNGSVNFGQRPFQYPPGGTGGPAATFKSLCTQNLDDPLIAKGSKHFDVKTFTGNGGTNPITGLEFSPDWTWIKRRNSSGSHSIFDTVRGATKRIRSESTDAETTETTALTAFTANGFTLGSGGTANGNNDSFVSWNWDGGDLATLSSQEQSQTWTNGTASGASPFGSSAWAHMFDGVVPSSFAHANLVYLTGSGTFTFPSAISGRIQVYAAQGSSTAYSNNSLELSDGSTINVTNGNASFTLYDFGTKSNITSITVNGANTSSGVGVPAILLDGKMLVNPGTISVGANNSSAYNTAETWSSTGTLVVDLNGSTVSQFSGRTITNAFNGNFGTSNSCAEDTAFSNGTKTYTFTFGTAFTNVTSARLYVYRGNSNDAGTISFGNGTVNKPLDGAYGWVDATSTIPANGTVSAMTVTANTGSGGINSARDGFHGIEINGKILLDTNVTPDLNFPSIPSTVRANQTAGFSIVTYSQGAAGSVVGHGLNKKPETIIAKKRNGSDQPWVVYHSALGKGGVIQLHATDSVNTTYPTYWGNSEPDSNVFGLYTASAPWANNSGNMVAYCFAPVEGYSAFGKYTGNGSAEGPFVYTGFRPAFIIVKRTSGTARNWVMIDTTRSSFNEADEGLYPNLSSAEDTGTDWADILSNGFKTRNNNASWNTSGAQYVYFCWAEHPFKHARAR